MQQKYKPQQSENGHQWFVMVLHEGSYKIDKVFYSEPRVAEYIKISTIVDSAIKRD